MNNPQELAEGGVIMLGSVPLQDSKAVFTRLCTDLPSRLHAVPDGERGERQYFVQWQAKVFPTGVVRGGSKVPDPTDGNDPSKSSYTIESFKPTGYDDAALTSYADFLELRKQGIIPPNVRFQLSLPTPLTITKLLCRPESAPQVEHLYSERLKQSLKRVLDNVPHKDLVVQWDMPFETLALEYDRGAFAFPPMEVWFKPAMGGMLDRFKRIVEIVPANVPIGFHLCYGDHKHKHMYEPKNVDLMVEFANCIAKTFGNAHHIDYFHMPVPIERTDVEYVQGLKNLDIQDRTRLCLGLIHAHDEAGTRKRIEVAKSVYTKPFAVATECGLGRTPAEDIDSIFEILKKVTIPII